MAVIFPMIFLISFLVNAGGTARRAPIERGLTILSQMLCYAPQTHTSATHMKNHTRPHHSQADIGVFEPAPTLILGALLAVLGLVLLVAAAMRLQQPNALMAVNPLALAIAFFALLAHGGLFRYMLAVAKRGRSPMLGANAWH